MRRYFVFISINAHQDINSIVDYIEKELKAPLAANRFYSGLKRKIKGLSQSADIYKISDYSYITKFGANARRINYKNFAIIYTIEGMNVVVQRIIHGSLIV